MANSVEVLRTEAEALRRWLQTGPECAGQAVGVVWQAGTWWKQSPGTAQPQAMQHWEGQTKSRENTLSLWKVFLCLFLLPRF